MAGSPGDRGIWREASCRASAGRGACEHVAVDIPREQLDIYIAPEAKKVADEMWDKLNLQKPRYNTSISRVLRPTPPGIPADDYYAFNPKMVSIGPLHHRDPHLKDTVPFKWDTLGRLLRSPRGNAPAAAGVVVGRPLLGQLVGQVWKLEGLIRDEYAEDILMSTQELVEMMVLDGCFILSLLQYCHQEPDDRSPGSTMADSILRNDLILLENQIPFAVLLALSEACGNPPAYVREKAFEFLAPGCPREVTGKVCCRDLKHLLHVKLLSYTLRMGAPPTPPPTGGDETSSSEVVKAAPRRHGRVAGSGNMATLSAKDLHAAGVKFTANREPESIINVSFDPAKGELRIPRLAVNKTNIALIRNLVNFEQFLPNTEGRFTGYAVFMDNIIDTAEDVQLLGRQGVVRNYLATDEEAAKFFNTLYQDVVEDRYQHEHYARVAEDIRKYCEVPYHGWLVKLKEDYFGSPWSGISVAAAVLALFLTAVQAYFSAFPAGS